MSEMKYLRERVDTFTTGPIQGVAANLQTSNEIQEPILVPNLPLLLKRWKLTNKQRFQVSPRSLSLFCYFFVHPK
jgi:hypothetical protein